jgi:hypothetical protein
VAAFLFTAVAFQSGLGMVRPHRLEAITY